MAAAISLHLTKNLTAQYAHAEIRQQALTYTFFLTFPKHNGIHYLFDDMKTCLPYLILSVTFGFSKAGGTVSRKNVNSALLLSVIVFAVLEYIRYIVMEGRQAFSLLWALLWSDGDAAGETY